MKKSPVFRHAVFCLIIFINGYVFPADLKVPEKQATSEKKAKNAEAIIEYIGLKEAKKLFDDPKTKIIDARPEHVWMDNRITGSVSVSAGRFDYFYPRNIKGKIEQDDLIMIYCSDINCKLSETVAEKLKKLGYKKLRVFTGGWDEWKNAEYPTEGLKVKK